MSPPRTSRSQQPSDLPAIGVDGPAHADLKPPDFYSALPDRLVELVGELLAPLYEIFDFFELSENLLKGEVDKVLVEERSTL